MWSSLWCIWSIATRWVCMLEESEKQQWIQRSGTSCTLSLKKTSGLQEKAVHSCLRPMFHPRSNLQNLQWPRPLLLQPSCGTHSGSPQKPRCVQEWGAPLILKILMGIVHLHHCWQPCCCFSQRFHPFAPPENLDIVGRASTTWCPWPDQNAVARVSGKLRHVQSL